MIHDAPSCPLIHLVPGVAIQFDPVTYTVPEGGSTKLRIVRVGNAPVSANVSTVVGTAGYIIYTVCFILTVLQVLRHMKL